MKTISVNQIQNIKIGQTENGAAGTGCTVFLSETGMRAGLDVRGGGPASRDSQLLNPLMAIESIHAVMLSGGSAFGLGAANGVMKYLEERNIGYDVGVTKVPLVVQSDIFDLTVGEMTVRPDEKMGYEAARCAFELQNYRDGNYGAGCGATVGKLLGMERCSKSGIASYAVQLGDLKVAAIVSTNAIGDVYDYQTNKRISGILTEDGKSLNDLSCEELLYEMYANPPTGFATNTTIGIVLTNGKFNKTQLCKMAGMTHDAYARCIRPVHTAMDGDSIYAMSLGDVEAPLDVAGTLANHVMCEAIKRSVQ